MQTAQLLEQLYNGKTLNKEESAVIFNAIMQGELNNEQIAAMLIALKVRGASTSFNPYTVIIFFFLNLCLITIPQIVVIISNLAQ